MRPSHSRWRLSDLTGKENESIEKKRTEVLQSGPPDAVDHKQTSRVEGANLKGTPNMEF